MSSYIYAALALTGGGAGSLDAIDGAGLADGDGAIVMVPGDSIYCYFLDADSAELESSPAIITPDTNAGDKRWIQIGVSGAVAFATAEEILAGVETAKAVAPAQLEDSGVTVPSFASAAEIITGTVANKTIAPDQLKAAVIVPITFANAAEIAAGTVADKVIAPDQLAASGAATGSGKVVRATSPTLVTPVLGTPASGELTNCTFAGHSVSAFVATILDDAAATNVLTTLGVSAFAKTILDDVNAAAARTTLGVTNAAFGSWESRNKDTIYQAATDGIITANLSDTGGLCIAMGYSDSNATPSTLRCSAKAGVSSINSASFTMPVKKNDYYRVSYVRISGSDTYNLSIYWLPLSP